MSDGLISEKELCDSVLKSIVKSMSSEEFKNWNPPLLCKQCYVRSFEVIEFESNALLCNHTLTFHENDDVSKWR